jgi:hypothetical protein
VAFPAGVLPNNLTRTEAHKMTFGDGVAFAILGLTVLIWVNLQMMGVI